MIENLSALIDMDEPVIPGVFQMVSREVSGNQEPCFEMPSYDDPRKLAWDPATDHQLELSAQPNSVPIFDEKKRRH